MKSLRIAIIAGLAALVAAAPLVAQNLLDNEEYRRAQELRAQAEEAFEEGEYDRAIELADEADYYIERAREVGLRRRDGFRAANARTLAQRRLDLVDGFDAETHFPDEYGEAVARFDDGQSLYDEEEYVDSRESFLSVLDVLDDDIVAELRDIARRLAQAEEEARVAEEEDVRPTEEPEPEPEPQIELPEYYVVRLIPERRDSFWRIAEYEFVYDDPWEWPRLYEANRDILRDPDNPDLIHPGMQFRIPSLDDEERDGVWRDGEIIRD